MKPNLHSIILVLVWLVWAHLGFYVGCYSVEIISDFIDIFAAMPLTLKALDSYHLFKLRVINSKSNSYVMIR